MLIFLGLYWQICVSSESVYHFDTNRNVKNDAMSNLGLDYDFYKKWKNETSASLSNEKEKSPVEKNVTSELYSLDGVYHFSPNPTLDSNIDLKSNFAEIDASNRLNASEDVEDFLKSSFVSHHKDLFAIADEKNNPFLNMGSNFLTNQSPIEGQFVPTEQTNRCFGIKTTLYFPLKSTHIDPIYKTKLQRMVVCLKENPNAKINIDGYTNSSGDQQLNLQLAEQRANNVKQYLLEQSGVDTNRIIAQGFDTSTLGLNDIPIQQHKESVVVSVLK